MSRMVRKQVYIKPEQDQLVKERATKLGVTEAELIRRGIDLLTRLSTGASSDQRAWKEELAFIRRRSRLKALDRQRGWTREDLYEERLQRFSRRH